MERLGIPSNTVTLVCSLKADSSIRAKLASNEIHKEILQKNVERDYFFGYTLVDMYAKCGSLVEADVVFNRISI